MYKKHLQYSSSLIEAYLMTRCVNMDARRRLTGPTMRATQGQIQMHASAWFYLSIMSLSKQQKPQYAVCCVKLSKTRRINGLCRRWGFQWKPIFCRWLPKQNRHPSILPKRWIGSPCHTYSTETACRLSKSHQRLWHTAVRFSGCRPSFPAQ